jgi:hypothetical protein
MGKALGLPMLKVRTGRRVQQSQRKRFDVFHANPSTEQYTFTTFGPVIVAALALFVAEILPCPTNFHSTARTECGLAFNCLEI